MAVRITGLVSGLDTDSIVQELVSAYSKKQTDVEKKQTKLSWTQDAWKDMNTKIYGFYSSSLTDFKFLSNFDGMKKVNVGDPSKATITAGAGVTNGTQTLKINKLATGGYLTGAQLHSSGDKYKKSTKLSELGIGNTTLKFKVGDEETEIDVNGSMSINDFTKALNEKGVKASFDEGQQRFFIQSEEMGVEHDFGFVVESESDLAALKKFGLAAENDVVRMAAEKQADKDIAELMEDESVKALAMEIAGIDNAADFDALDEAQKSRYLKGAVAQAYDANKGIDVSDKNYTNAAYIESRLDSYRADLVENNIKAIKESDKYEEIKKNYAVKQDASDAEIEFNGAVFEGSSNTFNINGMTITAKGVTDSAMSIVTDTDVDAVYNKIVGFIKDYNEVINAMDSAYNADAAKGYEPLSDDEKESMSDKEVEKWEQKIKDSLLRRDSTLNSIASAMKMAMAKSYTINGKSYSLSSFGINTLGYFVAADNEKNAYHIDGYSEDDSTKSNADKLKAAIASDPDTVATFFNELAKGVYKELDDRMRSSSLSSAYKVYNDKQMQSEYDSYTEEIKKWKEKLEYMEEYYYNQFSAMESALSKLNSQQSQLSGLLGM